MTIGSAVVAAVVLACPLALLIAVLRWWGTGPPGPPAPTLWDPLDDDTPEVDGHELSVLIRDEMIQGWSDAAAALAHNVVYLDDDPSPLADPPPPDQAGDV